MSLAALTFAAIASKPPTVIVIQGFRPASEAIVSKKAMSYLPFEIPKGVTQMDVTAELDGFYADACISVPGGKPRPQCAQLAATARQALSNAMRVARTGTPLNKLGAEVELTVNARGHAVCTELMAQRFKAARRRYGQAVAKDSGPAP